MAAMAACSLACPLSSSSVVLTSSARQNRVTIVQQLECVRLSAGACHVSGSSSFLSGSADLSNVSFLDVAVPGRLFMAVPKKKTSRTKTKIRKAIWLAQGTVAAEKAYSLAKAVLSKRSTSFIFKNEEEEEKKSEEESS